MRHKGLNHLDHQSNKFCCNIKRRQDGAQLEAAILSLLWKQGSCFIRTHLPSGLTQGKARKLLFVRAPARPVSLVYLGLPTSKQHLHSGCWPKAGQGEEVAQSTCAAGWPSSLVYLGLPTSNQHLPNSLRLPWHVLALQALQSKAWEEIEICAALTTLYFLCFYVHLLAHNRLWHLPAQIT